MNVKFSRDLAVANREFVIVFNAGIDSVVGQVAADRHEEMERARAERLAKFNSFYTD